MEYAGNPGHHQASSEEDNEYWRLNETVELPLESFSERLHRFQWDCRLLDRERAVTEREKERQVLYDTISELNKVLTEHDDEIKLLEWRARRAIDIILEYGEGPWGALSTLQGEFDDAYEEPPRPTRRLSRDTQQRLRQQDDAIERAAGQHD